MTRHGERGQVLPLWAFGIVGMLVLVLLAVRYADIVRWQIRAQNAADAAAQAAIALQTQQFNEMNSLLYASAVEEYRIRQSLYGMELAAYNNGGCSLDSSCASRYLALRVAFDKAVNRYTSEVSLLNRVTANMDFTTTKNDAAALVNQMQANCNQSGGGDCAFSYVLLGYQQRSPVYDVRMDARAFIKPSLGTNMTPAQNVNPSLMPAQVEVAVCADVPSPIPAMLGFQPPPVHIVARAAATAVQVEQDWFQPGELENPYSGSPYQPTELAGGTPANDGTGTDWYAVDFGGNANTASVANNGYTFGIYADEFSAFTGWWNAVPIRPFMGAVASETSLGCTT